MSVIGPFGSSPALPARPAARLASPLGAWATPSALDLGDQAPPKVPPPAGPPTQPTPWYRRLKPLEMAAAVGTHVLLPGLVAGGIGAGVASLAGGALATGFAIGAGAGALLGAAFLYALLKIGG